jgi:hypothetical protein
VGGGVIFGIRDYLDEVLMPYPARENLGRRINEGDGSVVFEQIYSNYRVLSKYTQIIAF